MVGATRSLRIKLPAILSGVVLLGLFLSLVGAQAASASTTTVTISGSMEGNLPIHPGDTLKAGFDITMPGTHPAATVYALGGTVTIAIVCPNGTTGSVVIQIPAQTLSIPANSSGWFPSGDQSSSLVYQGSVTAPAACGSGVTYHAPKGATFSVPFISSDTTNSVHIRFHYSDNTSGSWSGTGSFIPPSVAVMVGYADSFRSSNGGPTSPSPWQGASGVNFDGAASPGGSFDAGAIRVVNAGSSTVTVSNASITIGNCTFDPWTGTQTAPANGGSLILTQTDSGFGPQGTGSCQTVSKPDVSGENVDTSETVPSSFGTDCPTGGDGLTPSVAITISGSSGSLTDSGKVLNTGGRDTGSAACGTLNETHQWQAIS